MKKRYAMKKHDTHHQHQKNILLEFVHVSKIFNYHSDAQRQMMDLFMRNDGKWRLSARPERQENDTHSEHYYSNYALRVSRRLISGKCMR